MGMSETVSELVSTLVNECEVLSFEQGMLVVRHHTFGDDGQFHLALMNAHASS